MFDLQETDLFRGDFEMIGQIDTSKPITELPLCPVCEKEKGWVYCFGQFVCGGCAIDAANLHNKQQLDFLKQMKKGELNG